MEVRIIPFIPDRMHDFGLPVVGDAEEKIETSGRSTGGCSEHPEVAKAKKIDDSPNAAYWGIYLDDKRISLMSSKESAEKVKLWIEVWLRDRTSDGGV